MFQGSRGILQIFLRIDTSTIFTVSILNDKAEKGRKRRCQNAKVKHLKSKLRPFGDFASHDKIRNKFAEIE